MNSPRPPSPFFCGALGALLLSQAGCRKQAPSEQAAPRPSSSVARPNAPPLDRLAPSELPPGEMALFGLVLPQGMSVQGQFRDSGFAFGALNAEAVANYVRARVDVARVEVGAARTIFPTARIKGGQAERVYRIEVVHEGPATRLIIHDTTPAPPRQLAPMTEEERWRRAGFTKDGKPLDPKAME